MAHTVTVPVAEFGDEGDPPVPSTVVSFITMLTETLALVPAEHRETAEIYVGNTVWDEGPCVCVTYDRPRNTRRGRSSAPKGCSMAREPAIRRRADAPRLMRHGPASAMPSAGTLRQAALPPELRNDVVEFVTMAGEAIGQAVIPADDPLFGPAAANAAEADGTADR